MNSKQAIGIFDSGIGGLTVLKEIHQLLPTEDLLYLGDTARVPYGTKSPQTVIRYSLQNSLFLLEKGVKAIVVACNTASAFGLLPLQNHFRVPIVGVIEPGVKAALSQTKLNQIGIIGTEGTIQSGAYVSALKKIKPQIMVHGVACPLLVGLAEEGWTEGEIVENILKIYLKPFNSLTALSNKASAERDSNIDSLILGCTHYPLFKKAIKAVLGESINLVDSAVETAKELRKILKESHALDYSDTKGKIHFYSTDTPERMKKIGHRFLGHSLDEIEQIDMMAF